LVFVILQNDERVHPYQRGRASITGFGLELRENMETERLVGVATTLVRFVESGIADPRATVAEPWKENAELSKTAMNFGEWANPTEESSAAFILGWGCRELNLRLADRHLGSIALKMIQEV
jgi:hypothetical protein